MKTVHGDTPPSGKKFEIDGMTLHRIVDGKIAESLANEDTVGLMMQLGVDFVFIIPSQPEPFRGY